MDTFLRQLDLPLLPTRHSADRTAKVGQILAYLDAIRPQLRPYSTRRPLVAVDCGTGNAYLSFLVYYYYTVLEGRSLTIHCLDTNARLMANARRRARQLSFDQLHFHTGDIADFTLDGRVDLVYALHACGAATDKALHLGLRHSANHILAVACCQHGLRRQLRKHPLTPLTKHRVFKERFAYMVGDALRALLLEMRGYKVDLVDFVSSRHTEKNTMIRARKGQTKMPSQLRAEYLHLRDTFHLVPPLEGYLEERQPALAEESAP